MNRGNQGPECRGFRVTVSSQWRRLRGPCSGPVSPRGDRVGVRRGLVVGTKHGRPDFSPGAGTDFGPAAPTCSAAPSPRVTPSGSAAPPRRLARCAPPGPHSAASRLRARRPPLSDEQGRGQSGTYPDLRLQLPKTTIQPRRCPRATGVEGPSRARDAGGAAADSTARPRSVCGAVSAGCTWGNFGLSYRLPRRGHQGLSPGPRGLRAWSVQALGARTSRVP